jgi:glucosamine--fructose-6-phosphate aminotransferase (isomerizing)
MNKMIDEILEIPKRAFDFWNYSEPFRLPVKVPYLGMGSSYFAPLAFKYMNIDIYPELASEYFYYHNLRVKLPHAVLLSQSGRSSEALWCENLFESYVAITNNTDKGTLKLKNGVLTVPIMAGEEHFSSSKTYINTLLALFKGFGFDALNAIKLLDRNMSSYERMGNRMADEVYDLLQNKEYHCIYITGSGPNISTAFEASLILSESTKMCFTGLPMSQYDHGPKETASNSIVIQIISKGKAYDRTKKLNKIIAGAGAHVITVEEPEAEENFSVIHNIVPFNFMAYFLATKLKIRETFVVGGKVTEVI